MTFAICNEIFDGWNLEEAMRFAARTGYEAIEIAPFTIAPYVTQVDATRRQEIRDAAARVGILISGIHWVLAKTQGLHLTHPDEAMRHRTGEYLAELVGFCADVGGTRMIVGSPKQRNRELGVSHEQASEWARAVFAPAVQRAEDCDVVICFEPLSPAETNFINTAAEARALVATVASPAFQIILDVKAMSSEDRPIPAIIHETAGQVAYFHANDRNLKGPGFGDVDFKPIAQALREIDYQGVVSVEVFDFTEGPEVIATRSLAYLRQSFADEDDQPVG